MNEQSELMQELFRDLLQRLDIDGRIIAECLKESEVQVDRVPVCLKPSKVSIEVNQNDSDEPYWPLRATGEAENGMFLLVGPNSTGKTTMLATASVLLGLDWHADDVQDFMRGEEGYLDLGQSAQDDLAAGRRDASITIVGVNADLRISIKGGNAQVALDGQAVGEFSVPKDGWTDFWEGVRPHVHVRFIPQKRDYLEQLHRETASAITRRLEAIEKYTKKRQGDFRIDRAGRELRVLAQEAEDAKKRRDVAATELEDAEKRFRLLQRIHDATASDAGRTSILQEWAQEAEVLRDARTALSVVETLDIECQDDRSRYDAELAPVTRASNALQALDVYGA